MQTFNEKEFKKALATKDKQVLIDLICQYKWERDYFERKYKSAKKAVDLLLQDIGGKVVGIRDNHIIADDIAEALAKERVFNKELYDEAVTLGL